MIYKHLDDTVSFGFALNGTDANATDASTDPQFFVRKRNTTFSLAPTYTGDAKVLSHASYPDGCYEVNFTLSTANGFEANSVYGVYVGVSVSSKTPTGYLGDITILNTATSAVVVTPSDPGFVTGYAVVYDENGDVEPDVDVTCTVIRPSYGHQGVLADSAVRTVTSDSVGLVQFTNLIPGWTYEFDRGDGVAKRQIIPENATDPYELKSFVGTP